MNPGITSREIYARHTGTEGKSYAASHLVWSTDEQDGATTFIAARNAEAAKLNDKARQEDKPAKAKVEQITHEQYLKERAI